MNEGLRFADAPKKDAPATGLITEGMRRGGWVRVIKDKSKPKHHKLIRSKKRNEKIKKSPSVSITCAWEMDIKR